MLGTSHGTSALRSDREASWASVEQAAAGQGFRNVEAFHAAVPRMVRRVASSLYSLAEPSEGYQGVRRRFRLAGLGGKGDKFDSVGGSARRAASVSLLRAEFDQRRTCMQLRIAQLVATAGIGLLACSAANVAARAQTAGQAPGTTVAYTTDLLATVESVDQNTREVVLRGPNDGKIAVFAGPEIENLSKVKAGDKVRVHYIEALAASLAKPGSGAGGGTVTTQAGIALGHDAGRTADRHRRWPGENQCAGPGRGQGCEHDHLHCPGQRCANDPRARPGCPAFPRHAEGRRSAGPRLYGVDGSHPRPAERLTSVRQDRGRRSLEGCANNRPGRGARRDRFPAAPLFVLPPHVPHGFQFPTQRRR